MKKFKVTITKKEIFTKVVEIEAETEVDAREIAGDAPLDSGWTHEEDSTELETDVERINPPYDTVDFPAYALSALFNDDLSGMSGDDLKHLHNWTRETETRIRANHGQKCQIIYDAGEDTYFSTAQVFGLPATCVELEIHVIPEPEFKENMK